MLISRQYTTALFGILLLTIPSCRLVSHLAGWDVNMAVTRLGESRYKAREPDSIIPVYLGFKHLRTENANFDIADFDILAEIRGSSETASQDYILARMLVEARKVGADILVLDDIQTYGTSVTGVNQSMFRPARVSVVYTTERYGIALRRRQSHDRH